MGELGFSIKFWKLESVGQDFKARDTVTFVFQDRPPEDWSRLGVLIEDLASNISIGKVADILSVKHEKTNEEITNTASKEAKETNDSSKDPKELKEESTVKEEDNESDKDYDPSENSDGLNGKYESNSDDDSNDDDDSFSDIMCDNCGRSYSNRKRLISHLADCNPMQIDDILSEDEDYYPRKRRVVESDSCDNCLREFTDRNTMARHLERCNPEQLDELPRIKKKKVSSGGGPYTCKICQRQFTFRKSLQKHEDLHSSDPEHASIRKGTKERKKKPDTIKNDRGQYQCDRCECDFKVFSALERHIEAHDLASKTVANQADMEEGTGYKMIDIRDGKIMRCKRCDLAFKSHGVYRMHMQKFHKKMFHCEECSKKFTLPNTLIKHRLNYHTNFPKSCGDCGVVMPTKHQFVRHVNTQHGTAFQESNVPCEICGKLVKNKYTLKQHVKLVHEKKKGEFACDQCGKVLKSKGSLDYHKRTHTGEFAYRCDECGRGHMRYDKMMECLAEHQGIHKYQCPHCEYKSNQLGYYKKHLTTHSDAKPFTCPICGHNSSTSTNLNGHTKKVHKITLCQAEGMMKKNRHGRDMNEEELEQNRITLQRNQKVPGEPSKLVAEARKRGKPNRPAAQVAAAHIHQPPAVMPDIGGGVVPGQHIPAASGQGVANHHDAAMAHHHSWESNMARIEAGLRQDMMNRHEMARHESALGRLTDQHGINRIENLVRPPTTATVGVGVVEDPSGGGGMPPKQERNLVAEEAAAAANLVMPRHHMLFPVHKYFQ